MMKRAECERKIREIEERLKRIGDKTETSREYREHQTRLKKHYEREYRAALGRIEPPVGMFEVVITRPRPEGNQVENKQRSRGYFEEGFRNF